MRYLSIKNLNKHQHYKNRRPPWIKLHVEIFDDYAMSCLQDASKLHLIYLWLLASQMDNRIPFDLVFIARKLGSTSPIDMEELVLQGFIEISQDDGKMLAIDKQMPIVETETETEKRHKKIPAPNVADPKDSYVQEGVSWWKEHVGLTTYPRFGAALKLAVTEHSWEVIFPALQHYVKDQQTAGKPAKVEWFVADLVRWIRPRTAEVDEQGDPTPAQLERWARL